MLTDSEWSAVLLSLRVAVVTVAVMTPPSVALAWVLARKRFYGKALLDAVVHAPLVLPPVVVGFLLLVVLGRNGPIGSVLSDWFGIEIAFTWWAAVIASGIMAMPLMVRSARLGFELADPRLDDAARTLGAPPWATFVRVTLPLAMPGVLTGVVLGFARSLGEFGATIMFAGNIEGSTRTLPLAIFTESQTPGADAALWRLVIIAALLSLGSVLVSQWLVTRGRR